MMPLAWRDSVVVRGARRQRRPPEWSYARRSSWKMPVDGALAVPVLEWDQHHTVLARS